MAKCGILVFLTIIISVFDGQIFEYKQLPLNVIMMMPYNRLPKANNFGVLFDFTMYITSSISYKSVYHSDTYSANCTGYKGR